MTCWPHPLLLGHARIPDAVLVARRHEHRLEVLTVHHPELMATTADEDHALRQALDGRGSPAPDHIAGLRTFTDPTDPDRVAILVPGSAVRVSANGDLRLDGGGWARIDLTELGPRHTLFFTIPDATTLAPGQDPDPHVLSGVEGGLHWDLADRDRWLDWMGLAPAPTQD